MKNFFYLFALAIGLFAVACSSDEGYNADSAQSNYVPVSADKMVASVYTTSVIDGREYSWKHLFSYDKQGRIKEVNSVIKHHDIYSQTVTGQNFFRECNITSNAKYFYDGANLKVVYTVKNEYPTYPVWNNSYSFTDAGILHEDGFIKRYVSTSRKGSLSFECNYKLGGKLDVVDIDGGYTLTMDRDASGNVTGFYFEGINDSGNDSIVDARAMYDYTYVQNKTNFDFSAYLGYWGVERNIGAMSEPFYANYQLAAFGFFGAVSPSLPLWNVKEMGGNDDGSNPWEFDSSRRYPVRYTDPSGRVTEITYIE